METESTDGYARLEEAARVAKVNEKTVRNWADARKIGRKKVKGVVYYNVADLEEQGAKNAETKLVRDNPYAGAVLPQLAASVAGALAPRLLNAPAAERAERAGVPLERKLWLTLDEASEYTGVAKSYIREMIPGKRIGPHGAVVYRRQLLEDMI